MGEIIDLEKVREAIAKRLEERLWITLLLAEISLREFRIDTATGQPVALKE